MPLNAGHSSLANVLKRLLDVIYNVYTLVFMKTKVSRWGNSLALRLPKQVALSQNLDEGTDIEIQEERGGFFVRTARKQYSLSDLLKGVDKKNLHPEDFPDDPQGNEIW